MFQQSNIIKFSKHELMKTLGLTFYSGELEDMFWVDYLKRSINTVRFSMVLAFALYALFGLLDNWIEPASADRILVIRAVVCSMIIAALIYSYSDSYHKRSQVIIALLIGAAGAGVIGMILITGHPGSHMYYAGLILIVVYSHVLFRIRYVYLWSVNWAITAAYFLVALLIKSTPGIILVNNSFFLASANLMGMLASYSLEYYQKRDFWQRRMLDQSQQRLCKENTRKSKELEGARQLQLSMLPQEIPDCRSFEFAFSMQTATEVGGDYYDFFPTDDGRLILAIGDATGHGAQAGAIVTASKMALSCLKSEDDIVNILDKADEALKGLKSPNTFMAMALCRINDGYLEFAGAGMPPALLYRARQRRVEKVPLNGMPLGSPVKLQYHVISLMLEPGDTIFFMSDGFPEMFNPKGEMFGYERVEELFSTIGESSPKEIIELVKEEVSGWLSGQMIQDDITVVVMRKN